MDYFKLINELVAQNYLRTPLLIEAFKKINRADFLPEDLKDEAGVNAPLPIGYGQTNSQPLTVAFMLELLQPQPGDRILDIGSGSGWTSALLAWCVSGGGEGRRPAVRERRDAARENKVGKVYAIERIPELCEFGKQNIAKYNYIAKGVVKTICADGTKGLAEEAPFDKIIAAASAGKIPAAWKEQLKIGGRAERASSRAQRGGRLVLPVENSIWLLDKTGENKFEEKEFPGFVFVPLIKE